MFGTNADLKALFVKAKQLNIKIILDFVSVSSILMITWSELRISRFQTTPAISTNGSFCQPIGL